MLNDPKDNPNPNYICCISNVYIHLDAFFLGYYIVYKYDSKSMQIHFNKQEHFVFQMSYKSLLVY